MGREKYNQIGNFPFLQTLRQVDVADVKEVVKMSFVIEPERKIPVYTKNDVVVCGGGVAGLGAAIAAVRNGVGTLLIDRNNALGGDASIAGSALLYESAGATRGILKEVVDRMVKEYGAIPDLPVGPENMTVVYEPESFKQVVIDMCEESGVKLLLYTQIAGPIMEGNEIKGVFIENKSGRQAVLSDVVVDCTGDADVAAGAGAPYIKGRETDNKIRPVTLYFRVGNINFEKLKKFAEENSDQVPGGGRTVNLERGVILLNGFYKLVGEAVRSGDLDPYLDYFLRFDNLTAGNSCRVNTTRVYNIDPTNAEELTKAELRCRKQIKMLMRFLREKIAGFESAVVLETSAHIGIRESRHITGEYVLSPDDFDKTFDDAVWSHSCKWTPGYDMHDPDGPEGDLNRMVKKPITSTMKVYRFQVPYRCLVPQNIEHLLVAGRCISATGYMRWETRSIESCIYTGQAAGTAAALCSKTGVLPRKLNVKNLQQKLLAQGYTPVDVSMKS
jgi:ribulose 1,5-bisphosphate synthetase/thiazole synthase